MPGGSRGHCVILGDRGRLDRRGGMNIWMEVVPFNGGDSPIELPIAEWVDTRRRLNRG
jgi:hypothetical protein